MPAPLASHSPCQDEIREDCKWRYGPEAAWSFSLTEGREAAARGDTVAKPREHGGLSQAG